MPKTNRIIQLLNLLHTRKYVALDTIIDVCGIPRRTAFRYLNTLSAANVPLYFDRENRAYTLSSRSDQLVNDTSVGEVILIIFALEVLKQYVSDFYGADIDSIVKKFLVRQPVPLEEVVPAIKSAAREMDRTSDASLLVTSVLVLSGVTLGRQMKVSTVNKSGNTDEVSVRKPSLVFGDGWKLSEDFIMGSNDPAIKAIKKVAVL